MDSTSHQFIPQTWCVTFIEQFYGGYEKHHQIKGKYEKASDRRCGPFLFFQLPKLVYARPKIECTQSQGIVFNYKQPLICVSNRPVFFRCRYYFEGVAIFLMMRKVTLLFSNVYQLIKALMSTQIPKCSLNTKMLPAVRGVFIKCKLSD